MSSRFLPGVTALFALIALAGAAQADGPVKEVPADCGAAALQESIGKPVAGTKAEDATVGGAPVQSKGIVRVFATGDMVTQDFAEDRLNLETDAAGNLVSRNLRLETITKWRLPDR